MNRRKLIYFLSAFVLIIGCYALNLSYSLFTATASSEGNIVESTVPILNASLEEDTFTIPANSSKLIILKINKFSKGDNRYSISIDDTKGTIVQLVEGFNITGIINSESKQNPVLVYVTNPTEENADLTFKLEIQYATLAFDENKFIAATNFKRKDDGTFDTIKKTLSGSVIARTMDETITDEDKTIYDDTFDSYNISVEDTTGYYSQGKLILAEDDYGTSYVYRGTINDNYVNFAGFTWRIVRINGDGSIRLILDGTLDAICHKESEKNEDGTCKTYAGNVSGFQNEFTTKDNAYVGYMYGLAGTSTDANRCLKLNGTKVTDYISTYATQETCEFNGGKWTTTAYEATHANVNDSIIKTEIDTFYKNYIENGTTKQYEKYLADTLFCGDKTMAKPWIGGYYNGRGYETNYNYYAAAGRLTYSSKTTDITTALPTLKCASGDNIGSEYDFSRYTVGEYTTTLTNVITNGDLTYPIALLSADELVLAGASEKYVNQTYYLYDAYENGNAYKDWWLLTPGKYSSPAAVYIFSSEGSYYPYSVMWKTGIRPVINLKADLLLESGDGTETNPYIIKEIID